MDNLTLENNLLGCVFFFPFPTVVEHVVGSHVEDAVTFWAQVNSKNCLILTEVFNCPLPSSGRFYESGSK